MMAMGVLNPSYGLVLLLCRCESRLETLVFSVSLVSLKPELCLRSSGCGWSSVVTCLLSLSLSRGMGTVLMCGLSSSGCERMLVLALVGLSCIEFAFSSTSCFGVLMMVCCGRGIG